MDRKVRFCQNDCRGRLLFLDGPDSHSITVDAQFQVAMNEQSINQIEIRANHKGS